METLLLLKRTRFQLSQTDAGNQNMNVKEIEIAITRLSPGDLAEFSSWFADHRAKVWDGQIGRDLDAGRLDTVIRDVDAEYDADKAKPL